MSRKNVNYTAVDAARPAREGVDVTTPVAGFYRMRLRSGGVRGGVRLYYGPPLDPVTGEELDRGWRWQAEFDGYEIEFERVWPQCTGDPITEQEYGGYCRRRRWAEQNAPDSAYADPMRKLDLLSSDEALPF